MRGSPRHGSCSLSLVAVPRRHRQSLQTLPAGSRLAEAEYERAQGTRPARIVVGSRCRLGAARPGAPRGLLPLARGRITRRRRRLPHRGEQTAQAGARRRRSHRRRNRCCANSTSSPSAPGSTPTHPRVSHPTVGTTCSSRSASRDARQRYSASSPAATPTARSPTRSSSASRPPASTSRTSCESSTRPTDARRPRSRTASPPRPYAHP